MVDVEIGDPGSPFQASFGRKRFLKNAAVAVAALSGAAGAGGVGTASAAVNKLNAQGRDPLIFNGWGFEVSMVNQWVARFNKQNHENASFNVIPGDYPSVMETRLLNHQKVDTSYVLDSDFARWVKAHWIHDFESWPSVAKAKAEMYPSVIEGLTIDGKLYGLPYFTSVSGCIATNQKLLNKVGIQPKDYPKTWKELYDQMRHIKKSGAAQTPWLPRWINEYFGIGISIYEEMAAQGLELVDAKGHPIFSGKTEHVRVLEDGKRAWDDGLIPKSVLTMSETDQIDGFSTGKYAMSQQQIYDAIGTFNNPQRSRIAGYCRFVPFTKQAWGHLQLGAYVVPNYNQNADQLARDFRLAGWAGYKDNTGDYYVAKRWAVVQTLGSGYRAVLEDPQVIAAYKKLMPDYRTMMPQLKQAMSLVKPLRATRQIWFTDWNAKARQILPNVMLGSISPAAALDQLRAEADRLVQRYHSA
ncbi:MAG: putative ABC-type sugar transport system, periplasmic component [Chloroflexi bacterium]|jgi:multiple sugar transport system substrate-binding protein|nr:putative ABC-type sugar transport system, periplasmic component [Chloroflexota bacterium]